MSVKNISAVEALGSIHITKDTLEAETMKLSDTSKKIRFLLSKGKTRGEVYKLLKKYGVTTKDGNEIRYQFINNVYNQKTK